jgi:hypothetical protein
VALSLISVIVNTGCARSCGWCPVEDATNAVFMGFSQLDPKWQLTLESSCVNYDHGIYGLNLYFSSMDLVDLCDARYLLVDIVDTYTRMFNDNYLLSGELKLRPMLPEDLNIVITFESFFGAYVDEQYLNQIRMYKGCVTYYDFEAFDPLTDVFHRHSEAYNNTRLIVAAQMRANAPAVHDHNDITGVPRKPKRPEDLFLK